MTTTVRKALHGLLGLLCLAFAFQAQTQAQPAGAAPPQPHAVALDPELLNRLRLSAEDETCTICTPDELLQLRLRRHRALAEMRSLLEEIKPLEKSDQMLEVVVESKGQQASESGRELLDMIRSGQQPAPAPAPRPRVAPAPRPYAPVSAPAPRPAAPKPRPRIDALYAQLADPEIGVPTNAIIRVGRRSHALALGRSFDADGVELTMTDIEETPNGLVVVLTDKKGKETRLPWK